MPFGVAFAVLSDRNPLPSSIRRFNNAWSGSMTMFRNFRSTCRIGSSKNFRLFISAMTRVGWRLIRHAPHRLVEMRDIVSLAQERFRGSRISSRCQPESTELATMVYRAQQLAQMTTDTEISLIHVPFEPTSRAAGETPLRDFWSELHAPSIDPSRVLLDAAFSQQIPHIAT